MAERVPKGCVVVEPGVWQDDGRVMMFNLNPAESRDIFEADRVAIVPLDGRFKITKAPKRARRKKHGK